MQSGYASNWQRRHTSCAASLVCLALSVAPSDGFASNPAVVSIENLASPGLMTVELVLNGVGVRNLLFLELYQVALYLPRKLNDPLDILDQDIPRRLRITLLRDVSAQQDLKYLLGGLNDNNNAEELAAIQVPLDQFLTLMHKIGRIPKGGVVQLDYLPTLGTRVWLNQHFLGAVPGAAFNRSLLKIWLGERPIQNNLKRALLGEVRDSI
jgi:hypothetical protein